MKDRKYQTRANPHKLAFVFGNRSREIPPFVKNLVLDQPVFRETLEQCDHEIAERLGWSLISKVMDEASIGRKDLPEGFRDPLLTAVQIGLCDLLESWNIIPEAVIGICGSEFAGAYRAGLLSLGDAIELSCRFSRCLERDTGLGTTMAIHCGADETEALRLNAPVPFYMAIHLSSNVTVISCQESARDPLLAFLKSRDVTYHLTPTKIAMHCPIIDMWADEFLTPIETANRHTPNIVIYSPVVGGLIDKSVLSPQYWWDAVRKTAFFRETTDKMILDGYDVFLEVGVNAIYSPIIQERAERLGKHVYTVSLISKGETENNQLYRSRAELRDLGYGSRNA